MKYLKVEIVVAVNTENDIESIKKWEHHIDYAIDMDSYPEIHHIEGVTVTEMKNETEEVSKKEDEAALSDMARGILHSLCIMNKTGDLHKKNVWGSIVSFCHIDGPESYAAIMKLKENGYIDFKEKKNTFSDFIITKKGMEENRNYLF